ncbi:MFS transporter [Pseudomonas sp. UBA2684]|uniref:MFS transporter n=1 Tax=Pseudomonas sp. UBA2684 TaxID=1947311 RepID=UPI000E86F8B9|nr:MFS transporter [Pseudomonas sp. UBA2684]HBX54707.1 MFS transporter [Pseudomonas sp.]|tara:strand:- start:8649 stop:9905 length:1257 start_codon:yes stop_codon:yes gene_type:complete
MDALLILGGLLLILAGLVWLVMRAFSTSLLWGCASLLPPLTLFYVLRHWRSARQAVGLSALGFIPLIVGLTLLASQDSQRLAAILSLQWLKPEVQAPAELAIELHGELNGQPFAPQQGELIDGVLSLREGQDFFARREVVIRLPQPVSGALRLDVLPGDAQPLPEVEVSWLLPEQELPEARRLSHGYTLHLNLQPLAPNKLVGDFHLVLPPQFKTTLSGKVELFSDGLRYRDGRVDRHVDSPDTVAHVIEDYLQRRFATRAVQLSELPVLALPAESLDVQVQARINGQLQRLPILLEKSDARGWTVHADRFPALAAVPSVPLAGSPVAATASAESSERQSRPLDRRLRFSLEGLLRSPSRYQNLSMRVSTERGSSAEGRFQGIDPEGRIILRQRMSGQGMVSYTLRPEEVSKIELLEP